MEFGDLGKFRIKNGDVLTNANKPYEKIRYFDIFWYESDLKAEEINAYKKYIEDVYQSLYYLMCKEEKIKQLDNKEIKCENCTGVSKAHCFLGNIIRTRCPVCRQFYKPKNKDLIDYLRFKIIDSGYKKEESYNQNIILDTIKELEAYRINAMKQTMILKN